MYYILEIDNKRPSNHNVLLFEVTHIHATRYLYDWLIRNRLHLFME